MSTLSTPTASTTIKEIPAMTTTATFTETLHVAQILNRLLILRAQIIRMNNKFEEVDE